MNDVTRILSEISNGNAHATEELLPLIYRELRRLASQKMNSERPDHTIDPTALVHEVFIRLVDVDTPQHWNSRGHFYSAAAEAMRRILIESARRRSAAKRDVSQRQRLPLESIESFSDSPVSASSKLLALDEALSRLTAIDPVKAKLIELRYFVGLTIEETASAINISTSTANRAWAYAKAWLQTEIENILSANE